MSQSCACSLFFAKTNEKDACSRVPQSSSLPQSCAKEKSSGVEIAMVSNVRMRRSNTKTTVPLDVVPERRTKRFPPRFRPVGRFWELRFRYLSSPTGREGEISRPLDHMRQIPFIHSARFINSTNFYIYKTVF